MKFTDYYEILRFNIRRYRKYFGLKQKDLSKLINLSDSTISNIEIARTHASVETYCLIAEALGISMIDLLDSNCDEVLKSSKNLPTREKNHNKNISYKSYYESIVKNIIDYRGLRNLTQEKLAEKANLSKEYISKIESRKKSFSLDTLCSIANALSIDLKLLFEKNR